MVLSRTRVPRLAWAWPLLLSLAALAGVATAGSCTREEGADKTIELEFWTLALRPFEPYLREQVAAFEAAHPGVRVRWVDVPFGAADRKLIAAAAAGRAPDVINMSDMTFARFAAQRAFADMGPLLGATDKRAADQYVAGALRLGEMNGQLLALPWYLTTQAVLANTTLLKAGGLDPERLPTDWATLRAMAPAFRKKTGAFLATAPLGHESDLPMMLLSDGLVAFEPRGDGSGRLRAKLNQPAIVKVIGEWVELYRAGAVPSEAATAGVSHLTELYQNGRVAIINSGPNFLKRIKDVAPGIFEATAVRPPITGTLGRAHIAVMVVAVTKQSKHQQLAAELAWFMTNAESQEKLCELAVILPSTRASLGSELFAPPPLPASGLGYVGDAKVSFARSETARALRDATAFTPALAEWPDMRRVFEEQIKRVLLDGADVEKSLVLIEGEWNRILDASAGGGTLDAIPTPGPVVR